MIHQRVDLRPVDLAAVTKHVISDLAPMAVNAGYELHSTTETASLRILGDASESQSSGARFILNLRASSGSAY